MEPLKKAIKIYVDHDGIKGVPKGQMIDPSRILGSRFVLTNKGGEVLTEPELKARWIFGGHRDPDAGLYATSSPTASLLGHNLINFVAVQIKSNGRFSSRMSARHFCRGSNCHARRRSL